MGLKRNGAYILSIDAKDIYLANHFSNTSGAGYRIRRQDGGINLKKFINSLDYSLELIKLREVYEDVYGGLDFTFNAGGYEYTQRVINVTFKYSVKEWNKLSKGLYVKYGYMYDDVELVDGACVKDGELIAVSTEAVVENPLPGDVLGKYFWYEDGQYKVKANIKSVLTVADLRKELYEKGFDCDGIHYVRYKRSAGSSRVGKCLFIDEKLYPGIWDWTLCGLDIDPEVPFDLAAFESYISLTLSSIIGEVEIYPENILVIDDYESKFQDRAAVTQIGDDGTLITRDEPVEVSNSIWDGQSLMDSSLFGAYAGKGMLLLRARFFKSCCFNCNIQEWFKDHGITEIRQLNGYTLAKDISEVKLITTPSSIKYLKFGTLEQWLENLEPLFGVVKFEKPTHYFDGRLVQTHYQLINTLQMTQEEVDEFLRPTLEYHSALKNIPAVLRNHIKYPGEQMTLPLSPLRNRNEIVYKLMGINERFCETGLYRKFVDQLIKSLNKNVRCGHVLVNGNYSTLCGNPIEMLRQSIGKFSGESQIGVGNIHSRRFEFDKTILGSRSPHVTMGNVWLTTNRANDEIERYLNLTNEIVCINSIGENLLMRLSGADFDSDTAMLTDNPILIKAAQKNYDKFPVPTSEVVAKKTKRKYNWNEQADLDIATSVNLIAEIINLAQELNTLFWDNFNAGRTYEELEEIYLDIAQLDVLSNIEIDKAKKEYPIDSKYELKKLKEKYLRRDNDDRTIRPNFFGAVARKKGLYDNKRKNYMFHDTAMDYIQHRMNRVRVHRKNQKEILPFSNILVLEKFDRSKVKYSQAKRILRLITDFQRMKKGINMSDHSPYVKTELCSQLRQSVVNYIDGLSISTSTMVYLLKLIENPQYSALSRDLFDILFGVPNETFFTVINISMEKIPNLVADKYGPLNIYGMNYRLSE